MNQAMRTFGVTVVGFCLLASCYSKVEFKTSEGARVGSLTVEFLPAAGDASDGYINGLELNGADPLWSLSLPEGTRVEFTGALDPSATCDESQEYQRATMLAARDLPQVDGSYMVCARFTDLLNVVTYRKTQTVVRDVVPPAVDAGADIWTNVRQALDASTAEAVAWEWRKKSGEGAVTFDATGVEDPSVQADTEGSYVLQLTAWDAAGNSASDELTFSWDTTPPTVANGAIAASAVTTSSMALTWAKATDNVTPSAELRYRIYHQGQPAFATLTEVKNGNAVGDAVADLSAATLTDLVDNAVYYVNVVVMDRAGNETVYTKVRVKTAATTTTTFKSIAVGGSHVCGLNPQGQIYCWGSDAVGELGNGAVVTTNQDTPSAIASAATFVQVTSGTFHACGLTAAGAAYCWGHNTKYQVGDGSTVTRMSPVAVSGGLKFRMLEGGGIATRVASRKPASSIVGERILTGRWGTATA